MPVSISRFFADMGMPLHNDRWSWGASKNHIIVLRTWEDQYSVRDRRVAVLHQMTLLQSASAGLDERIQHLKSLWNGGIAAYTVIATATDAEAETRSIKSFRDELFPIDSLSFDEKGTIYAHVSRFLDPASLEDDARLHRTSGGEGQIPLDEKYDSGLSSATVREKLPYMREWLIDIARRRSTVQYSEMMRRFDLWYGTLYTSLKLLGKDCVSVGEPVITALVVDKNGKCSEGITTEFGIHDDRAARRLCYAYWAAENAAGPTSGTASNVTSDPVADETKEAVTSEREALCARFMMVEVRQQQATFRKAVFLAYEGRCAISGCDVPEALEAAHFQGRSWKEGHNDASDGILLRRDLHTLYDRGLLKFPDGFAHFDERVVHHYSALELSVVFGQPVEVVPVDRAN